MTAAEVRQIVREEIQLAMNPQKSQVGSDVMKRMNKAEQIFMQKIANEKRSSK